MTTAGTVGVLDYGVGNLGSVLNMFRHIDVDATLVTSATDMKQIHRLLLPGVGAFDRGALGLEVSGLAEVVTTAALNGMPVLGICLGMQLLGESSDEGARRGLGLLDARCERFSIVDPTLRVPHMGWNWVSPASAHALNPSSCTTDKYYFAHSYRMVCHDPANVVGVATHGEAFPALVACDNVAGAQFHPEKSHRFGMDFLRRFSEWAT